MSKILFSPREDKIQIFKPSCNVLFIIVVNNLRLKSAIFLASFWTSFICSSVHRRPKNTGFFFNIILSPFDFMACRMICFEISLARRSRVSFVTS